MAITPLTPEEQELKQQADALEAVRKAIQANDAAQRSSIATDQEKLVAVAAVTAAQLEHSIAMNASLVDLEALRVANKRNNELVEEGAKALEEANKKKAAAALLFDQMNDSIFSLGGGYKRFAQQLELGTGGLKEQGLQMIKSVKSGALAKNILHKIASELINFGLAQDKTIANFRAQTGAGDEFNETIRQGGLANIAAGVSLEDVASAIVSLKNEYTDFTYLSQEQANEVTNTTSLLNKLGFSFSTQAGIMQTATQTMGMSVDESQTLLLDLASTARSLGMDINILGAAFEANKDFLIRFGDDGQEVFEELAVAAKALGTDLGTLIEVTEKFKTFDSAAQSVGRLNAILGGPFLNSMDMLNASYEDPIEGIRMLREGFEQAGVAVDDLGGAELEAFASALGLSVSKTKELLGSSEEQLEIERMQAEELATMAKETQDIMTQLSQGFKQVLIEAKPIIDDIIIPMISGLSELAGWLGENTSLVRGLTEVVVILGGAVALATGGLSLLPALAVGLGAWSGISNMTNTGGTSAGGTSGPARFAAGGVTGEDSSGWWPRMQGFSSGVGSSLAIVGEQGPEMVDMPNGTRVNTAPKTEQLTNAITKLISKLDNAGGGSQNISVYIGQEKIDEIVIAALNSPVGVGALSPFGNG